MNQQPVKNYSSLLATVIAIHVFFFVYAVYWGNIYVGDFKDYLSQATNIKEHLNWYSGVFEEPLQSDLYSRRPPAYGFFIFLIKSVYNSDYAVLFVQSILSILNFWGLTKLLEKFNFKFNVSPFLIFIVVMLPSQFIYANLIMSEILFQTFLFWSFYNIIQFILLKKSKYILYYNIFVALALLTKPVLYLFWIINLILMVYLFLKCKRKVIPLLTGIIPLAVVLLISIYNYKVTGYFHYSSLRHNNILDMHSNYIFFGTEGPVEATKRLEMIKTELDTIKDYAEQSKLKERIAFQIIKENFWEYLKYHTKGMINFFFDPGRFEPAEFFQIKSSDNKGIYIVFLSEGYNGVINYILKLPILFLLFLSIVMIINILIIFSIINFLFEKKIQTPVIIYFLMIIGYVCMFTGIIGALRYKMPLFQIMLFSIPFFVDRVKSNLLQRKSRKISPRLLEKN